MMTLEANSRVIVVMTQSIPQQIRTRVLNKTVGQWMRAVDLVLSEYSPQANTVEEEADHVTKLSILMMLTRWYDEEDICLLLNSSALRLPKRLAETSKFDITQILDRPSDHGRLDDLDAFDADAPPGADGPRSVYPGEPSS